MKVNEGNGREREREIWMDGLEMERDKGESR